MEESYQKRFNELRKTNDNWASLQELTKELKGNLMEIYFQLNDKTQHELLDELNPDNKNKPSKNHSPKA